MLLTDFRTTFVTQTLLPGIYLKNQLKTKILYSAYSLYPLQQHFNESLFRWMF